MPERRGTAKAGRPWGPLKGTAVETQLLARWLRGLLDHSGVTIRALADAIPYSRDTISRLLAGGERPDWTFVAAAVSACAGTDRQRRDQLLAEARQRWEAADPARRTSDPSPPRRPPAGAASDRVAQAQRLTAEAQQALASYQRLCLVLQSYVGRLQEAVEAVRAERDDLLHRTEDAQHLRAEVSRMQERLDRTRGDLADAEDRLAAARAAQQRAERLAGTAQRAYSPSGAEPAEGDVFGGEIVHVPFQLPEPRRDIGAVVAFLDAYPAARADVVRDLDGAGDALSGLQRRLVDGGLLPATQPGAPARPRVRVLVPAGAVIVLLGLVGTAGLAVLRDPNAGPPDEPQRPAPATEAAPGTAARKPLCLPVSGDWNGDGADTVGLACRQGGILSWSLHGSTPPRAGSGSALRLSHGDFDDCLAVTGDWDGDGTDTVGLACVHPGQTRIRWQLRNTNTAGSPDLRFDYGDPASCRPVTGDWDNDGADTAGLACVHPGQTRIRWQLRNTNTAGSPDLRFDYGDPASCRPVTGDWDNDGADTVGVACRQPGRLDLEWMLRTANSPGAPEIRFGYGNAAHCRPVSGDWNGDDIDTPGLACRQSSAAELLWGLNDSNASGVSAVRFVHGAAGEIGSPGWAGPAWAG